MGVETSLDKSLLKISPFASLSQYDNVRLISHLIFCYTSSLKRAVSEDEGLKMNCSSLKRAISEDDGFLGGRKTHHKKGSSQTTTPLFVYIGKTTVIYFFFGDIR